MSRNGGRLRKAGIPIGLFAVGALAGALAGVLFAPKAGKETRKDIKETAEKIKNDIAKRLSALREITQDRYEAIVRSVVDGYKKRQQLTAKQAKAVKADLKKGFKSIKNVVGKTAKDVKEDL